MTEPGTGLEALQEPAALADAAAVFDQRRQVTHQSLGEAGQLARRQLFEMAEGDPSLDGRLVRPDVWAVQVEDFPDLHELVTPNRGPAPFTRTNAGMLATRCS